MTLWDYGIVCVSAFALLYVGILVWHEAHPLPKPTVTNEEDRAREVQAYAPQHDYSFDDLCDTTPESISEYLNQRKKTASRG